MSSAIDILFAGQLVLRVPCKRGFSRSAHSLTRVSLLGDARLPIIEHFILLYCRVANVMSFRLSRVEWASEESVWRMEISNKFVSRRSLLLQWPGQIGMGATGDLNATIAQGQYIRGKTRVPSAVRKRTAELERKKKGAECGQHPAPAGYLTGRSVEAGTHLKCVDETEKQGSTC
jgi:hypothetical protein